MKHILFWPFLLISVILVTLYVHWEVSELRGENPASTALIDLRLRQAANAGIPYETKRIWKNIDEISPHLVHAVLLAEDGRFYHHRGFDLAEIREAVKINWRKKRYAYGGSTITQQLARNLYLSPKKTILRKFLEAYLTLQLEYALSKKRILELYLNIAEWGKGIYGAEAASQFYFTKAAADLTPDEAVALASILPSPRRWNPASEKGFMARRRSLLFQRMQRAGYVPEEPTISLDEVFEPALPSPEPVPAPDELQGVIPHQAPEQVQ